MELSKLKSPVILSVSVIAAISVISYLYINDIYNSMKKTDKDD